PSPWSKAVPKPEVYFGQIDPDGEGNAVLWFRSHDEGKAEKGKAGNGEAGKAKPEELGWKSIRLKGVDAYPHRINPLSVLPDGRLYGTGDDYAGTFIFDPRTDQTTYCGPRTGLAPYTTIVSGDKLYSSGYAGGPLFVYDPAQPWVLGKGGPPTQPGPDEGSAASNPRRIGEFRSTRVAIMP